MTKNLFKKTFILLPTLLFTLVVFPLCTAADDLICLGGMPFGVKLYTDGVIVSMIEEVNTENGTVSPALNAGLKIKDIITDVNGKHVTGTSFVASAVAQSEGAPIRLTVKRGSEKLNLVLLPEISANDGKYKAGMWLKDSTAGVGTVTYIDPSTGEFAGLGHGICDNDTGEILPLLRGVVMDVNINGIKRGIAGAPGELVASFKGDKIGALTKNEPTGVYGIFANIPSTVSCVKIADRHIIHDGEAKVLCSLDNSGVREYSVELSAIDRNGTGSKNFIVTVTDKTLLEKTGGIVQGMSGSPIVQDGMLVGAVTHVLVNDPTKGYGIFIENMLAEAEKLE